MEQFNNLQLFSFMRKYEKENISLSVYMGHIYIEEETLSE